MVKNLLLLVLLSIGLGLIICDTNANTNGRVSIKINKDTPSSYSNQYNTNTRSNYNSYYNQNANTNNPSNPYNNFNTLATLPKNPHISHPDNYIPLQHPPANFSLPPQSLYAPSTKELQAATATVITISTPTTDTTQTDATATTTTTTTDNTNAAVTDTPVDNDIPLTWQVLADQCYTYTVSNAYLFTICPFHNITQTNLRTGITNLLGIFSHWKQSVQGFGLSQTYKDGKLCKKPTPLVKPSYTGTRATPTETTESQNQFPRKIKLLFECSYKDEIQSTYTKLSTATTSTVTSTSASLIPVANNHNVAIVTSVTELRPCYYIAKLHTPLACEYSKHTVIPPFQPIVTTENEAEIPPVMDPISTNTGEAIIERMSECIQSLAALNSIIHTFNGEADGEDESDMIIRRLREQMGDNIESSAQRLSEKCQEFWDQTTHTTTTTNTLTTNNL